jgi:hypothetical protein
VSAAGARGIGAVRETHTGWLTLRAKSA